MWGMYGKGMGKFWDRPGPYQKGGRAPDPSYDALQLHVSNLSFKTGWQSLKDFMKQAGNVAHVEVMSEAQGMGKGMVSPRSAGTARVEFSTAEEAQAALEALNGAELDGRELKLDPWVTGGGKGKGTLRELKLDPWVTGGKGKGTLWDRPGPPRKGGRAPDPSKDELQLYVSNLAFETGWQSLKDFMKQAGNVAHVEVMYYEEKGMGKGMVRPWSKGTARVEFSTAEEAQTALETLNGAELDGREIKLDTWVTGWKKEA